ncbi:glycoside hydrolase superfamily [Sordaria brevicollis]|uniref:Glycoside hydrolase superfamily n=1 Tax=Sordaria brevicollis TaxID=83679 RepID=A0AAE0NVQ0_SORBR|nr:glycoside hydrolase superfamily [Sordaria brevicollis]
MGYSAPVFPLALVVVATLFGQVVSIPFVGDHRDRSYDVDQHHAHARHGHTRYHPRRLLELPVRVNETEPPEALLGFEDGRYPWSGQKFPTKTGRTVEEDGSMTLAARENTLTNQTDTAPTTTATEVEEVVIYVDENSQTMSAETNVIPIVSQATSSLASSSSSSSPAETTLHKKSKRTNLSSYLSSINANKKLVVKPNTPKPKTSTNQSINNPNTSVASTNTTTKIHPGFLPQRLPGVTYAPYDLSGCRSPSNIASDFRKISKTGLYSSVRIYGVDCSQVLHTLRAASSVSPPLKLFLGIFNLSDLTSQITTLVRDIQTFASNPGNGKPKMTVEQVFDTMIDTISVGNELVNNGQATPAQVLSAVRRVREALRREGYTGPVVTVDTFVAVLKHPQLCASPDTDYCAVNLHPFFDPHTDATKAANFVKRQNGNGGIQQQKEKQKRLVITETGWPTQGNANNKAVPGRAEQKKVVEGVRKIWQEGKEREFGDDGDFEVYLFTAFDDPWKKAEKGTFYAEQFWGIHE